MIKDYFGNLKQRVMLKVFEITVVFESTQYRQCHSGMQQDLNST